MYFRFLLGDAGENFSEPGFLFGCRLLEFLPRTGMETLNPTLRARGGHVETHLSSPAYKVQAHPQ